MCFDCTETLEKQIRILMHENEKFKRHSVQIEGFIQQLKGENDELQEKVMLMMIDLERFWFD